MTAGKGYKRSWKNYLLNARYQLRFTLFMVLLAAVLMTALGYWVVHEADKANRILVQTADMVDKGSAVAHMKLELELLLGVMGLALAGGLFVYGIVMTHKVAGPLFKVGSQFDKVRDGKFEKIWPLRKGDQLREFFEHFLEAHGALRKREEEDVERLKEVVAAARAADLGSKSVELGARVKELEAVLARKEAGLG